jgi:hypothetical protein
MINYFINKLFNFSVALGLGILMTDFFERKYPMEFQTYKDYVVTTFYSFIYNCILNYSKFQIILIKVKNKLNILIDSNPSLLKLRTDMNNYFNVYNVQKHANDDIDNCDGYNFYIHNYYNNTNIVNRQIYYKDSNNPINEPSYVKFILVEFKLGDNCHKIDLKTDLFNYYLVGNKFTKDFFIYYIKKHININDDIKDTDNCSLKIIDHNVNNCIIDFRDNNQSIVLEKNDYKINVN